MVSATSENYPASEGEEKLDSLGLRALELMQQVVQQKLKLQEHIKAGSINLAKSRYIMGQRNVSTSQLPTQDSEPFRALRKVQRSVSQENGIDTNVFSSIVNEPPKKQKSEKAGELEECDGDSRTSSDPLHWFGVLVPQNLRLAQSSFKKAVDLSVQIVNLQMQLEALRIEFCSVKLEQMKLT
ncbi:coiled-coil domain-containing protein 115-like [Thrips palmi]|uniref:Vacuolar ATPase assembly protein VMA22 n=1 Tax=Thrips palmi TaxID=161013 RepID=A0A6P8ZUI1_THRPL|nr:coiled-coil domain-containing protein 115-like [Thrips palmi]